MNAKTKTKTFADSAMGDRFAARLTEAFGAAAATPAPETLEGQIARLELDVSDCSEARVKLLARAHLLGVSDAALRVLVGAVRISSGETITLPAGRYEHLSRGKGWARQGSGDRAVWGERTATGYAVTAGRWTVGSDDGFRRQDRTTWDVTEVRVGATCGETWLAAS